MYQFGRTGRSAFCKIILLYQQCFKSSASRIYCTAQTSSATANNNDVPFGCLPQLFEHFVANHRREERIKCSKQIYLFILIICPCLCSADSTMPRARPLLALHFSCIGVKYSICLPLLLY